MADLTEFFDFTTSTEFNELCNQLSEEMENQPKTVFYVLKETPCPQNTEDVEKKPSVLKTLLQNSTPTTKTTTTTVSTSSKKHKVPVFSTPVVSEENDHKISEVPFKSYATCETTVSTPYYSPAHDENWPPSIPTGDETKPSFLNSEDSILTTFRRTNQKKFQALKRRLTDPDITSTKELKVLRALQKRMKKDLQQSEIIMNYLEEKYKPTQKKES